MLTPTESVGQSPGRGSGPAGDMGRGADRGFTLVEMMFVLVILAILTAVALPAYQGFSLKGNRAAGRGILLDVMARQEQYFLNNKTYALSLDELGLPAQYYVDRLAARSTPDEAIYRVELDVLSSIYQGVRAVPQNRQMQDTPCMTLSVSTLGLKTASGSLSASPLACW